MQQRASLDELQAMVRTVADFPKAGIQFRDITTLIANGLGLSSAIAYMADIIAVKEPQLIAGMEARGFIFGAAVAAHLGIGFVPVRKPGKLPVPTIGIDYALEYGTDRLEVDPSMFADQQRAVIVDDLIATGGTALATVELLRSAGAMVSDAVFAIDLPDLGGAAKLTDAGVTVHSLMQFAGE